jgi:peptide/nickel transport system substrate-binding protein
MDEHTIRELVAEVKRGRLSRRQFLRSMAAVGVTASLGAEILSAAGIADAQPREATMAPARRGGGGPVRMLYWAAPTLLNPHLAVAPKDYESSQLFYEPLADINEGCHRTIDVRTVLDLR